MSERFICLGDSITEGIGDEKNLGWVGRLALQFAKTQPGVWNTINLGVAGDTSIDILHRLKSEVVYREPARLIIAAGVNDTALRQWPTPVGSKIDLHYAREVWMHITDFVKRMNIRTVFISPLPVDETKMPLIYKPYDLEDKGNAFKNSMIEQYNTMLKAVVVDAGLNWIDLHARWKNTDFSTSLADGLHPNSLGYDHMAAEIFTALGEMGFLKQ